MQKIYATKITNTGGRSGEVYSPDHSFEHKVSSPGSKDKTATNPEQLFAAGYSACFNGALEHIMAAENATGKSTVSVTVSLYKDGDGFAIGADIEGHIDGLSVEDTEELLEKAHQFCPYSKATRGNIEVTIKAV